jgi:hypothetical protein
MRAYTAQELVKILDKSPQLVIDAENVASVEECLSRVESVERRIDTLIELCKGSA